MQRLIIAIIIMLSLLVSEAMAKSPPQGTGADDVPANILLMLDTSVSMNAPVTAGNTNYPVDVDFDSAGNMYVAEYYDQVEVYNAAGEYQFQFGRHTNSGQDGRFDLISAIAVDSNDYIYVSDRGYGRIQKFDSSGNFITKMELDASPAYGVAVDSSNNVYAVNGNGDVEVFSSTGTPITTWGVTGVRHLVADSSNNFYVTTSGKQIRKYNSSGTLLSSFAVGFIPHGIAWKYGNAFTSYLYISGPYSSKVYQYTTAGSLVNSWGSFGTSPGQWMVPLGVSLYDTGDNNIYIADNLNHRFQDVSGNLLIPEVDTETTRLDAAKEVIKAIVSDSNLTDGAHFGLMQWDDDATMLIPVSSDGASEIYTDIDSLVVETDYGTVLDNAMELAQTYFTGPDSPMDQSLSCQENILIVISDGEWQDNTASTVAENLYDAYGIRTFAVGFLTTNGQDNYVTLSQAGGTYPDSPLFASNQDELFEVLSGYIQNVISSSLSFSAPTIIPSVANEESIIQSVFTYKADHQWKGHLIKYSLNSSGYINEELWDAGDVLNETAADDRNIWTVATGLPVTTNNFIPASLTRLRVPLEEYSGNTFTDEELTDLIEFVRGKDSYNEFPSGVDDEGDTLLSGERWKLADIYHSRAVVVGSPSAYTSDESNVNSESYYRYINGYQTFKESSLCGSVCADREELVYVGSNSGMLHAFKSSTGEELWGFIPPSVVGTLQTMIGTEAGTSDSIFAVDGSPTVKDIYYNSQWRTILIGGLRQGGHSYFALDVTNPDEPEHLFSFASRPLNNVISYWNANGTRTDYDTTGAVPAEYDFRKLGESWSQPVIAKIKIDDTDKWVALIAGGYNNAINPNYGAVLYVLDMEDGGKIIQAINLPDVTPFNGMVNAAPPKVTAIHADSTTLFTGAGALAYVTDLEGQLWVVNLTDEGTLYEAKKYFNAQSASSNGRYSFHELAASIASDNDKLMLFFGTGDIQNLGSISANIQNRAYGIQETSFPDYTSSGSTYTVSNLRDTTSDAACPEEGQYGWYINLNANEKVAAKASVANGTLFLPRYTPNVDDVCSPGTAVLSEIDYQCGELIRNTDLGEGVPTEAIIYENLIYIGTSTDAPQENLPEGFVQSGNLIIGQPENIGAGEVRLESWRFDF